MPLKYFLIKLKRVFAHLLNAFFKNAVAQNAIFHSRVRSIDRPLFENYLETVQVRALNFSEPLDDLSKNNPARFGEGPAAVHALLWHFSPRAGSHPPTN